MSDAPSRGSGNSRNAVWITAIIAVGVLVALGLWFFRPSQTSGEPAPTVTVTVTATPAATPADGAAGCLDDDISVDAGVPEGTAGAFHVPLTFTNTGTQECVLAGYPIARFYYTSDGAFSGAVANPGTTGGAPASVSLAPGASATSTFTVPDAGNFDCKPFVPGSFVVLTPGGITPHSFESSLQICSAEAFETTVSAVAAGGG